jgi:hypothetical protein
VILTIPVLWEGPYEPEDVVRQLDGGGPPARAGEDHGVYQVYGSRFLSGRDTLLYVGRATEQTFAARLREHAMWLSREEGVRVYVGRVYAPGRHTSADVRETWARDVRLAEHVMIHKYSPSHNGVSVAGPPALQGFEKVVLSHEGPRHRLHERDVAPDDWPS